MSRALFALAIALFGGISAATADDGLIVHEWGTFTSLQDERGDAVGGINADDEPVPGFVHRLRGPMIVDGRAEVDRRWLMLAKSIPASHPDVTMRLETPVIYFHPPKGASAPMPVEVAVTFRGGWLTEFFPWAAADLDGARYDPKAKSFSVGRFTSSTYGSLTWSKLMVGTDGVGPKTEAKVWLAPRAVPAAANVTAAAPERKSESEKFLFYRGVGHLDSPLRVVRDGETLRFDAGPVIGPAWYADVRADGRCAFRGLDLSKPATAAKFADAEYRPGTDELRSAMRAALIADGLFADEADAMLNTWQVSYFQNAGTRVFFMVPRAWTDRVLPLAVSAAGKAVSSERTVRTMVGRVELVTPAHRELLKVVANPPDKAAQLRAYKALGRFRDALVLDEHVRGPTAALAELKKEQFIGQYNLSQEEPADVLSGG